MLKFDSLDQPKLHHRHGVYCEMDTLILFSLFLLSILFGCLIQYSDSYYCNPVERFDLN